MTPEERAVEVCELLARERGPREAFVSVQTSALIASAIREAEAAVKGRCAKAAESIAPDWHGEACGCGECVGARSAAEAIRALP